MEETPYYFYASEKDDFDNWNEAQNRELGYARYGTSRYLQSGYEDYEYEMSRSGRWSYMSEFNSYAWIPYNANSDWMPYANGRWVWNPYYGYVWISYDTCGWFTHHYGRWHWSYTCGWYWIPSYHWSPAWVSWFGNDHYYGWCPLSWWNRPVIIINNHWDRHYDYRRGIPHHSRSTIIIRKNELSAANAIHAAIRKDNVGPAGPGSIAFHGAAPNERPAVAQVTVINARGRTVAYKQNGIVSKEKYKISNDAAEAGKSAVYRYNNSGDTGNKYSPRVYQKRDEEKAPRRIAAGILVPPPAMNPPVAAAAVSQHGPRSRSATIRQVPASHHPRIMRPGPATRRRPQANPRHPPTARPGKPKRKRTKPPTWRCCAARTRPDTKATPPASPAIRTRMTQASAIRPVLLTALTNPGLPVPAAPPAILPRKGNRPALPAPARP